MLKFFSACLYLVILVNLINIGALAQDSKIDSLRNLLIDDAQDSSTVIVLNKLSRAYVDKDPVKAKEYNIQAITLAASIGFKPGLASSYIELGTILKNEGSFDLALSNFLKSLSIYEETKDSTGVAKCLSNIGTIHFYQKNYNKTLDYWGQALGMQRALRDTSEIARMLNNIGVAYEKQKNYEKALEYHKESLDSRIKMGDKRGVAESNQNIAIIHAMREDFNDAIKYFEESLEMRQALGNKRDISQTMGNIGQLYLEWTVAQKKQGIAQNTFAAKLAKAKGYIEESLRIAKELKAKNTIKYAYKNLSEIYENQKNTDEALRYFKQYSALKDSLFTEQSSSKIAEMEANYQVEKEKREQEIAEIERKRIEAEQARVLAKQIERRHLLQYSGILIFIVAFFIILLFSGKLNIPIRLAEGGIFFTFLLIFEFILVLSDPYIENWTGGEPAFKLLINAGLAAMIFPLHSLAEENMKRRLFKTRENIMKKRQKVG